MLAFGGNEKFKEYLKYYALENEISLENKYSSMAALFYRQKLHSFSLQESFEEPQPNPEEGRALVHKEESKNFVSEKIKKI
mgnify:CR=1 FL=1